VLARRSAWRWSSGPGVGRLIRPERSGGPPAASSSPLAPASRAASGAASGERSEIVSEALRTVAKRGI
jgi:hypothetical protein